MKINDDILKLGIEKEKEKENFILVPFVILKFEFNILSIFKNFMWVT